MELGGLISYIQYDKKIQYIIYFGAIEHSAANVGWSVQHTMYTGQWGAMHVTSDMVLLICTVLRLAKMSECIQ